MTQRPTAAVGLLAVVLLAASWTQAQEAEAPADSAAFADTATAPAVAPATDLVVTDAPNDNGHSLALAWTPSSDDRKNGPVLGYEVHRAIAPGGPWTMRGTAPARGPDDLETITYRDSGSKDRESGDYFPIGETYYYKIRTLYTGGFVDTEASEGEASRAQWFHLGKLELFVAIVIFTTLMLVFINKAKKGQELYIRPLAGIDAVDDAIGRATEMGKPILYVMGLGVASDIATIASFTILGRVAKKVAEYQTKLIVPCYDPIVMTVAQETVKAGYLDAGRPDEYRQDDVYFVTQSQFAYVAAVNGTMLRERPATNFYLGLFYAESLILAETGALAGSIQISGTDQVTQIPFFVVACDYTLIGEELYAASAYLGREPLLMGTLKAQDWAKGVWAGALAVGTIATFLGWDWLVSWFHLYL
jgi:hypothetical protein